MLNIHFGFLTHCVSYVHSSPPAMTAPRLPFLYPHLFRPFRISEPIVCRHARRLQQKQGRSAGLSSTSKRKQETYAQRYGPANEPHPPPQLPQSQPQSAIDEEEPKSLLTAIEKEVKAPPPAPKQDDMQSAPTGSEKEAKERPSERPARNQEAGSSEISQISMKLDAAESHPKEQSVVPTKSIAETKPLETLLKMESPDEEHKPPHLHAPPYVHHFDTFTLVRDLEKGGFTEAQSVTLMKAVRSLLALNLDVAREGLVSKSDVENVLCPIWCSHPLWQLQLTGSFRRPTSFAPPAQNSEPRS